MSWSSPFSDTIISWCLVSLAELDVCVCACARVSFYFLWHQAYSPEHSKCSKYSYVFTDRLRVTNISPPDPFFKLVSGHMPLFQIPSSCLIFTPVKFCTVVMRVCVCACVCGWWMPLRSLLSLAPWPSDTLNQRIIRSYIFIFNFTKHYKVYLAGFLGTCTVEGVVIPEMTKDE